MLFCCNCNTNYHSNVLLGMYILVRVYLSFSFPFVNITKIFNPFLPIPSCRYRTIYPFPYKNITKILILYQSLIQKLYSFSYCISNILLPWYNIYQNFPHHLTYTLNILTIHFSDENITYIFNPSTVKISHIMYYMCTCIYIPLIHPFPLYKDITHVLT